jgi:two-component system, sensor histidine kinase and response regulator
LSKQGFDGVLMDCQMPVMDGYDATIKIRQQEKFKDLPVIALTANMMKSDIAKILSVGMNDHIGKPINVNHLFSTMAKWITRNNHNPTEQPKVTKGLEKATPIKNEHFEKTAPATNSEWPDLPGIDIQTGLKTTYNNAKLFRKLLTKFTDNQKNFEKDFYHALKNTDMEESSRLAHTLKGVAGNLGMIELQQTTLLLETACHEQSNDIEEILSGVISQLNSIFEGLKNL